MNTYLVSYDLINPGQNYHKVIALLKTYTGWAKPLESTWLIKSPATAAQVRDHIMTVLDRNDKLLVITATAPAAWSNLDPQVTKWIQDEL